MLTVAHPWILILLPLPWLARALLPPRVHRQVAVRVPFGGRLRAAGAGQSAVRRTTRRVGSLVMPSVVWLLVLAALARPQWLEAPVTRDLPTRDLLLLVDLSGSMDQEDFDDAAGARVDRLTAVKGVLGEFLSRREGDRVGLVVFGDAPFLQAPFSPDLELSRRLLDETAVGMAGPRTALGDAIGLGVTLFEGSDAPARTIIALTDGNDTASQVPPVEAARVAREREIRIHTVAIGDPTTAGEERLDEETLRAVAETAGGEYFFAADRAELDGIYAELDSIETRDVEVQSYRPRRDLFFWPLLAAVVVLLLGRAFGLLLDRRAAPPVQARGRVRVHPLSGKLELIP